MVDSVLVVDDDLDLLEVMEDVVGMLGVSRFLGVASLGGVVAERHRALGSRLAILDINLGEGQPTGVEVFRWLRDAGFAGDIVFLTGHATNDPLVVEAARVDARILSKPLSADELRQVLEGS